MPRCPYSVKHIVLNLLQSVFLTLEIGVGISSEFAPFCVSHLELGVGIRIGGKFLAHNRQITFCEANPNLKWNPNC